jgi:hypothetical protein
MVTGPPLSQDRRLAHRRIRAHDTGEGIKPGLVYKEDALLLGLRPLLIAGHVASRQRAIAASSRWRARRAGFCGLQRITWHKRLTWRGWYEMLNASCMTAAIRLRVQTCPRKPYASAPRCNSSGRRASCSGDKRLDAPGWGRCRRASAPPSRARVIHWLTAPS